MVRSAQSVSAPREFGILSFVWRTLASFVLVAATYNPTGYSYFHWLRAAITGDTLGPEHFVVGVLVVIGWVVLLVATQRSLGTLGLVLGGALLGGLVWLMADAGVITLDSASKMTWAALVTLAILLAIGLSWSHVWRRLTGQLEVDDDD
ncbi:MAG: DUF6524 family protein [Woeseia sp.]